MEWNENAAMEKKLGTNFAALQILFTHTHTQTDKKKRDSIFSQSTKMIIIRQQRNETKKKFDS